MERVEEREKGRKEGSLENPRPRPPQALPRPGPLLLAKQGVLAVVRLVRRSITSSFLLHQR